MAIIGTIGQNNAGDTVTAHSYTYVDRTNPATVRGKLSIVSFSIKAADANNSCAIKIFRIDGTDYDLIYSQTLTDKAVGTHNITLTTPVDILEGDLLGFWNGISPDPGAADVGSVADAGDRCAYIANEVTGTTVISNWTSNTKILDIYGDIYSIPSGGFSGFSPWIFMKDMWEKHNKIWTPKLILPKDLGFSY